jgi:hypothetical protein
MATDEPLISLPPDGLRLAIAQVERIPNLPHPTDEFRKITDSIRNLTTSFDTKFDTLSTKVNTLSTKIDTLQTAVEDIQHTWVKYYYPCIFHTNNQIISQDLLPMRFANASAGRSAPLRGLQGRLTAPAPTTREELLLFTGTYCVLLTFQMY